MSQRIQRATSSSGTTPPTTNITITRSAGARGTKSNRHWTPSSETDHEFAMGMIDIFFELGVAEIESSVGCSVFAILELVHGGSGAEIWATG